MSPLFKPMKRRDFETWINGFGWSIQKAGSGDWKVLDQNGQTRIPFLKITHPGNEIPAPFVKKTEKALKDAGLL